MPLPVSYTKTYPGGFKNEPLETTSVDAAFLDAVQDGLADLTDAVNNDLTPHPGTGATVGYVATVQLDGTYAPAAATGGDVALDAGHLSTSGNNGDYASSQAALCSVTGPIDVRWFGSGISIAGTGSFRSIVNVEGAFDFRQLGSNGKLGANIQNGASSVVGNVGSATVPVGNGYRVTYDPATGPLTFEVLDPASGSVTTADGKKWTIIASTTAAITGNQLTAGAKHVGVCGLTTNGTEGNALETTRVQIFDGIDGTMVVDVDFTGQEDAPATGTFVDSHGHTWVVNGHAAIIPVSGTVTKDGDTLNIASKNDLKKTVGAWGTKRVNPLTGCFHLSQCGDEGVDPDTWTVAQESAAMSAARAAAIASIDIANGYGQTVYVDRPLTINADTTTLDPISGLPYRAIGTWDYLTIRAAGLSTPIKLADAQNVHVIGHPGRTSADGSQDQVFNFSLENVTIDGNRDNQDGTHRHDAIHIPQHPGYQLHNVRLVNVDGKGVYTTALGEFSSVPPRTPALTTGSTVWTTNTAPTSINVVSAAGFPIGGTTLDVLDGGGILRSVKYTGITGNTFTGVTLIGGVATAGTVAAGSPVYIDAGTHSVRPVFLTDVRAINCAQWGFFLSATNRDTSYKGLYAYQCGSPQALIAGNTVCAAIGANGHLDLVIDNHASVPIAFLAADTPATVVTKINTALGATGTAALTTQGILKITSATVGGVSKVYVQGTSTSAILTNLGLTTAPKNGDNNYRAGANEYGGFFLDHSECTTEGLFADSNYGDGFYIHNVNLCHYGSLHATRNNGIGIYVDALNHSTGWSWAGSMNCQDFGSAAYRAPADSAEIYFDNGTEGYGITKNSTITGIVGPGDKTTSGTLPDNRKANWSVYVADNITLSVGGDAQNGATLRLSTINGGDGGLTGVLRAPSAYKPTAVLPMTPTTKTANYTAVRGDVVLCDTTGGTFTVTIPAASAGVGEIIVKWVKGAVAPTIALSGSDHFNTSAGGTTATPVLLNQGYVLLSDTSALWVIAADDLPFTALQTQFDTRYAQLASPALTGNPTAPTQTVGDNSTKLSTTAFVAAAIAALVNSSPSTLDTLKELADALGDDPNFATTMTTALAGKLASTTTLDAIANPAADRAMNAHKITGLANGTADTDAQAFGQRPFDAGRLATAVTVTNLTGAQQLWAATTIPAAKLAVGSTFFYTLTGTLDNQATSGTFTFITKVNGSGANSSIMPSQTGAASTVFWSLVVYVTVTATGVGGAVNITGLLTLPTAAGGTQGQKIIGNVQAVDLSAGLTIRADVNMATASSSNTVRAQAGCCAQTNMP